MQKKGPKPRPAEDRFWGKVRVGAEGECWPWLGARHKWGYGKLFKARSSNGSSTFYKAHRLSWEIANGRPVPDGLNVLHSCDNPPCVNPAHLRVGTLADNAADRSVRRRGREHRQGGESNANAKLTESEVLAIVAELKKWPRRTQSDVAERFGVSRAQVSKIANRQSWSHLWEDER